MPIKILALVQNAFVKRLSCTHQHQHRSYSKCPSKAVIMSPECKVALVTGGSEGIGFQIANYLLKNGAKAVAISGLDTCLGKQAVNCLNNAYGRNRAMFVNGNSNCMVQIEETFKVVKEAYQNIDIVINSAAICNGMKWETEIVTNIIGTIRVMLLGYKYMGREGTGKGGGLIVNLSGTGGLVPMPPAPTLSCCYHGIVGLSRSFGDKTNMERSGVRVVCLCPGVTSTVFFKDAKANGMTEAMGADLEQYIKNAKKQCPDVVGMAIEHIVKFADSGTVWTIEGSRLFECHIPEWEKYSELRKQLL